MSLIDLLFGAMMIGLFGFFLYVVLTTKKDVDQ